MYLNVRSILANMIDRIYMYIFRSNTEHLIFFVRFAKNSTNSEIFFIFTFFSTTFAEISIIKNLCKNIKIFT